MTEQFIERNGQLFYFQNIQAFEETYHEIFNDREYFFETANSSPVILDCGSNTGVSVVYFKSLYPDAHITAFEPDPASFALLTRTVQENKLESVTLINAAVTNREGDIEFYGEFTGATSDARGNSIIPTWGDRGSRQTIHVRAIKLSAYIQTPIDFLKLDIEGAEIQAFQDIQNSLHHIQQATIEFHQTLHSSEHEWEFIISALHNAGFQTTIITKNIELLLPSSVQQWANEMHPCLKIIQAKRQYSRNSSDK